MARETFTALQIRGMLNIVEGNIDDTLAPTLSAFRCARRFRLFFDGNHRYEPTLRYFELCLAYRTNESVFVFDDIHWSEEMERAWEAIKIHPDVRRDGGPVLHRAGLFSEESAQAALLAAGVTRMLRFREYKQQTESSSV